MAPRATGKSAAPGFREILDRLRSLANPEAVAGMARYGISAEGTYGVSVKVVFQDRIAREVGKDHVLAQRLWSPGVHEARILAAMVGDPRQVTEEQMERWVRGTSTRETCAI